jgi:hypothetical protein
MKRAAGPIDLLGGFFVFWLLVVSLTEDIADPLTARAALYAALIGLPASVAYQLGKRSVAYALERSAGARHCAATDPRPPGRG